MKFSYPWRMIPTFDRLRAETIPWVIEPT